MSDIVLLDSDVILKLSAYALKVWEDGAPLCESSLTTLASSKFILPKRLTKARYLRNSLSALVVLDEALDAIRFIEPTDAEIMFAGDLELAAQRQGLAFDTGESQLLAVLVSRRADLFLTGDKRAIKAMSLLAAGFPILVHANGKIACLEQLFAQLVLTLGGGEGEGLCVQRASGGSGALDLLSMRLTCIG